MKLSRLSNFFMNLIDISERNMKFDGIKLEIWTRFDLQLSINRPSIIFRLCYGRGLRDTKLGIHIHEASIHIWWKFSMCSACSLRGIIGFVQDTLWKFVPSELIENDVISLSMVMRMRSGNLHWSPIETRAMNSWFSERGYGHVCVYFRVPRAESQTR